MEAESEACAESESVVGGLDTCVAQAVDQRGINADLMSADAAGQLDKGGQAAAYRRRHKTLQMSASVATRVSKDLAQLLL